MNFIYIPIPTDVTGLTNGVTAITAGYRHTCALLTSGAVKCWGDNGYGQLGDNTTITKLIPTDVTGLTNGVIAITAGYNHTCALLTTGGVKCWGFNGIGQLGDTTTTDRLIPTNVNGLTNGVTVIAAGATHTCALLATGAVKCWGWNIAGQLGDNTTTDQLIPTNVNGLTNGLTNGVTAITTTAHHTCALFSTGAVKCWGDNDNGQVGDNATTDQLIPTNVTGLTNGVTAIAAGAAHTCALLTTGPVKCWGANSYGALGDNTTNRKLIPTDVTGIPGAPTITTATAGNGSLSVAFTPGNNGVAAITNYKYSTDGTNYTALSPASTTSPLIINGLTNGTTYSVTIKAVNARGDSPASNAMNGTPTTTSPDAPTITKVTAGNGSLSVAFTPGSDGGTAITNYKYSTDGTNYTALSPASTTSPFTINGLTNGTTYSVTIKAVNARGDSPASNAMNGTPTAPATVPTTAPASVSVESSPATSSPSVSAAETRSTKLNKSLPDAGGEFEILLLVAALLITGGLIISSRRRLAQDRVTVSGR